MILHHRQYLHADFVNKGCWQSFYPAPIFKPNHWPRVLAAANTWGLTQNTRSPKIQFYQVSKGRVQNNRHWLQHTCNMKHEHCLLIGFKLSPNISQCQQGSPKEFFQNSAQGIVDPNLGIFWPKRAEYNFETRSLDCYFTLCLNLCFKSPTVQSGAIYMVFSWCVFLVNYN